MKCDIHQIGFTNYCTSQLCMQGLCPECIDIHIQMHKLDKTHPQLISISNLNKGCQKKVQTAIEILRFQEEKLLSQTNDQTFRQYLTNYADLYKQQLMAIIQQQINNIIRDIQVEHNVPEKTLKDVQQVKQELNELLIALNQNDDHLIDNLNRACQLDLKSLTDNFKKLIETNVQNIETIVFNKNYYDEFKLLIEKIIIKGKYQFEYEQISLSGSPIQLQQQFEGLEISQFHSIEESPQKRLFVSPQRNFENTNIEQVHVTTKYIPERYESCKIDFQNYFPTKVKNQVLAFFSERILYLVSLNNQIQQIVLKQDYNVPKYHKSLITTQGDIYLLGGVEGSRRSNGIYCFEPINRKLVRCGQLIVPRSSFGVLFISPFIYSCGGLTPDLTNICEKYNINTNKSELIAECLFPQAQPLLLTFNGIIYKFGSQVEKFDGNQWLAVNIKLNASQCLSGTQINSQQFIVFGGYDENGTSYSDNYIIDGDLNVKKGYPLIIREGFWNSQCIIKDNNLYALQNIEQHGDIDDARRKLVTFSKNGWI